MSEYSEKVRTRLKLTRQATQPFFAKVHRIRRLVAGDLDALVGSGATSAEDEGAKIKREYDSEFFDLLVEDIEEGRSNTLLQGIRTLALQTTHRFPEVEADDLEHEEAVLHSEYFRSRLGPPPWGCDAAREMRRCLYDYLSGGFGWDWIGIVKGRPVVRYVDTIDMLWDQAAPSNADIQWAGCTVRGPLRWWKKMYGRRMSVYDKITKDNPDQPVDLFYYYDIEEEGKHIIYLKTGDSEFHEKPLLEAKNPCYWSYGTETKPFLPFESMFFMELPSARLPIGLAEQTLPSQIALWRADKTLGAIVDCPAYYEYEKGALDSVETQKFEDGEVGSMIQRDSGKPPGIQHRALDLPQSLIDWRREHEQKMVGQLGANPYASGGPVEGTTFAAEVNAIQSESSLMAGTIAKDNADFWIRTLKKVLAKGSIYDEGDLVVRYDDINVLFDQNDPVKQYLRPDALLTIRESSMQFQDEKTRLMLARADLDLATSLATFFPNWLPEAAKNYLRARGEKNVKKFLEPPQQSMAPPGQTTPVAQTA